MDPSHDENEIVCNVQGVCPICSSMAITYGAIELEGDQLYYPAECDNGHQFNEWYHLEFIESIAIKEV